MFFPVAVTEITMETAPPTPFSFFSEFRVFLLEVKGRVQSVLLQKPRQRFAELFDELESSREDGLLLLQKSSQSWVFPEPSLSLARPMNYDVC